MIFGPEIWKEVRGVSFLYWDRWCLRLALEEPNGLDGLAGRFDAERRGGKHSYERLDAEAKLSHLDNLKKRLAAIAMAPREVLGGEDAVDKKLLAKSRTKLYEQCLTRKSPAMCDTPRRRLTARALRGWWHEFPVSPALYETELMRGRDRHAHYDWRLTMWLADNLSCELERLETMATTEADRLAIQRALLTFIVEHMERSDDSHASSLAMVFEDVWKAYLGGSWEQTGILPSVFFRDLVELCVWEDYGLVDEQLRDFFRSLAPDDAAVVEDVFAAVVPELRDGVFEYQEEKALRYRADFLVAQGARERFIEAAKELGARTWIPILAMAKAAIDAGDRSLALAIFSAADQPGPQRETLRRECANLLGVEVSTPLRRVK